MIDDQLSKFTSVEHIRDYLETELGDEKVMKAYSILREIVSELKVVLISYREMVFYLKRIVKRFKAD
jgi:hypothetical protein